MNKPELKLNYQVLSSGAQTVNAKILVIEDDLAVAQLIVDILHRQQFSVVQAANIHQANCALQDNPPELIIVDWMLPDGSGLDFIRSIRRSNRFKAIPIIMLTAKTQEHDRVSGLTAGADDYLGKPFSPRELVARIAALQRRASGHLSSNRINYGSIEIDLDAREVIANGTPLSLSNTEYQLLRLFVQNPNRVYSRNQLLDIVWAGRADIEERSVDVHILRLRKTLETTNNAHLIKTIRGAGYKLQG